MAATNAIGQGAVVLTASADRLLAGLDRAEKATVKFAKQTTSKANSAGKAAGGGESGGGIFGALMFGGAAGAAAGVALKGIDLVTGAVGNLVNRLASVGEKVKEYGNIDVARRLRIDRATKAFDRITAASDDFYFRIAEKVAPIIEKVAHVLEVVGYVGAEALGMLIDEIISGTEQVAKWADGIFNLGLTTQSATKTAFNGVRVLARGLGGVADTALLFGGSFLYTNGLIVEGLGRVIAALAKTMEAFDAFIAKLPTGTKYALFGLSGAAMGDGGFGVLGDRLAKVGEGMQAVGKAGVMNFGKIAGAVDPLIDKLETAFDQTQRIRKFTGPLLSGAALAGSNEAYSILAKNQAANILTGQVSAENNPVKIAKEQLKVAKEQKRDLSKLVDTLTTSQVLQVIA